MYRVDRSDFSRTAKRSAWFYADLIRENGFKGVMGQCPYWTDRERVLYDEFPPGTNFFPTYLNLTSSKWRNIEL